MDDPADLPTPRIASDRLLSPPGTVDVSIIERYIPSSTLNEINDMFSLSDQSVLVDRLVELSPNGGCLTIIYPTKTGGQIFQQQYLDPIMEPTLRYMMTMFDLSADLAKIVSELTAVGRSLDFDDFSTHLEALCETLSEGNASVQARLHNIPGMFRIISAEKHQVKIPSEIWSKWLLQQEKSRLQEALRLYRTSGGRPPRDGVFQQFVLHAEMVKKLGEKACAAKPDQGIEVGVYVIKRGA
ncbi:hypothetical protein FH972_023448 [Carpinus fangiana]|uniref:Uncharacterized protein n=1 Tax=Carpinus fangiana TaxID=176857 RepID=A0A5N6KV77_9ROSI|nr:hypothetical protein FH972_023448 [Carpinus fangiana]